MFFVSNECGKNPKPDLKGVWAVHFIQFHTTSAIQVGMHHANFPISVNVGEFKIPDQILKGKMGKEN